MKDIVINSRRVKKELNFLLLCFIVAFLTNVVAIIIYKTSWIEILTQLGYVLILAISLYFLLAVFRLVIKLLKLLIGRIKGSER